MCYGKNSHICEENISQLNLMKRFKKRSDLSLYDNKFDLIYCHGITREPGAIPRKVSFRCGPLVAL